jgi:hypothetical protein
MAPPMYRTNADNGWYGGWRRGIRGWGKVQAIPIDNYICCSKLSLRMSP